MSKSNPMHRRVESYFYEEPGTKRGVFVLPKGTLAPERPTPGLLEAQKQAELARRRPVLTSRGQDDLGYAVAPQNKAAQSGVARPERGWNPHTVAPATVRGL